jgi:dihydrofolate reductase
MAETVLYIAASVDGFVADADGDVAWLDEYGDGESTDRYEAFFAGVDRLVMGSRTYEQVLGFGEWPYGSTPTVVVTRRDLPRATDAVELYAGDLATLARRLDREHERVWLVGGALLARAFLRQGLVDVLRLHVVPVVLGQGVALFDDAGERTALTLVDATTSESGIVELHYRVAG